MGPGEKRRGWRCWCGGSKDPSGKFRCLFSQLRSNGAPSSEVASTSGFWGGLTDGEVFGIALKVDHVGRPKGFSAEGLGVRVDTLVEGAVVDVTGMIVATVHLEIVTSALEMFTVGRVRNELFVTVLASCG